jgi:hypothetical protein
MNRFDHVTRRVINRRLASVALGPLLVLVLQSGLLTTVANATFPTTSTVNFSKTQTVSGVRLSETTTNGSTHTYEILLSDREGAPVNGAELDLGGLQADPDIRVPTIAASPTGVSGSYQVSISYPSDGDWMLVVRVHSPTQAVELFTATITGAGGLPSHGDAANSPSRRALRAADPTFTARYSPSPNENSGTSAAPFVASHDSVTSPFENRTFHDGTSHGFDLSTTFTILVHAAGAGAWLLAVLGMVFANRLSTTNTQNAVLQFVARRYTQLAGGGLAVVTGTGLIVALKASAGLAHPQLLATTNIGIAYLAVFGLKMVLVAGAMFTSWRVGVLMPSSRQFSLRNRVASVGAMANEDPDAIPNVRTIFRLAETNMILAVSILGCVALLGQLHHAIA